MKTLSIIIVSTMMIVATAGNSFGQKITEMNSEVKVENFNRIKLKSVADVYFTQGDTYSVKVTGDQEAFDQSSIRVEKGTLIIDVKDPKQKRVDFNGKQLNVIVTAKDIQSVRFNGVGSFHCDNQISVNHNVDFKMRGVGSAEINDLKCNDINYKNTGVGGAKLTVNCGVIKYKNSGVGSSTIYGKAKDIKTKIHGVGHVNYSNLKFN
ncbi:MAG: DUF2807 domain-containing protein [Bacteroidales bacterium]|nr:DUF2807 domain-containing protein [Bacteroidales bacterium]